MSEPVKKIFLIAGENSGDFLGASLMRSLKAQSDDELQFHGIGGPLMEAEGLNSILPMSALNVMGIFEVIKHLPQIFKNINYVAEQIETINPDVIVTIDLPDFNFRVIKKLHKRGAIKAHRIHYVAPTVWEIGRAHV